MTTKILNFIFPVAIAVAGFTGAVKNNTAEQSSNKLAPVWGYKHVAAPVNCQQVQMCANTGSFICTSDLDGSTLYALTSQNPNSCPTILRRPTQ